MAGSTPAALSRIFISYRREETDFPASWLYERLAAHFGPEQVFKDVDSIALGDDFVEVITDAVGSCDVLLALIGDRWLTVTNEDGQRRLDDPNDFVRLEIEAALHRSVRVIPILVGDVRMPAVQQLPTSLAKLTRRQALELSPNRFEFDTGRLLRFLDRTLVEDQARRKAQQEAEAKARQEAARREAEAKARQEAARREAEAKAKQEAARREAEAKARQEAEAKARQEAEAKAKRDAEAKARQEAEAKAKRDAEAKAKQEAAKQEAEAKARQEAEAKAKRDAEAKARQEAEAKARQEAEAKAEAEAKREAEAKARETLKPGSATSTSPSGDEAKQDQGTAASTAAGPGTRSTGTVAEISPQATVRENAVLPPLHKQASREAPTSGLPRPAVTDTRPARPKARSAVATASVRWKHLKRQRMLLMVAIVVAALVATTARIALSVGGRTRAAPPPVTTTTPATTGATTSTSSSLPQGAHRLILRDDFSNQANLWEIFTRAQGSSRYVAGAYRFRVAVPDVPLQASPRMLILTDDTRRVRIDVDARRLAGAADGYYGIACRVVRDVSDQAKSLYMFGINDNGSFRIDKLLNKQWQQPPLKSGTRRGVVKPGQVNHLQAGCESDIAGQAVTLTLSVNGHRLARVVDRDTPLSPFGRIGVLVGPTYQHAPLEVVFDEFAAYET
jgi:TIR domain